MIVILHRYTKATLYASATANDIATVIIEAVKTGAETLQRGTGYSTCTAVT